MKIIFYLTFLSILIDCSVCFLTEENKQSNQRTMKCHGLLNGTTCTMESNDKNHPKTCNITDIISGSQREFNFESGGPGLCVVYIVYI